MYAYMNESNDEFRKSLFFPLSTSSWYKHGVWCQYRHPSLRPGDLLGVAALILCAAALEFRLSCGIRGERLRASLVDSPKVGE